MKNVREDSSKDIENSNQLTKDPIFFKDKSVHSNLFIHSTFQIINDVTITIFTTEDTNIHSTCNFCPRKAYSKVMEK